jgi:hypothetical protein
MILMTIDNHYKGIPIAYMIFTAHTDAKAIHVDYNTALMEKLIRLYINSMGMNLCGKQFCPSVAITDYDKRKCRALMMHFPKITLLICLFHIWQAWQNALNKNL